MHRFFVAPELLQETERVTLPERLAHQVRDVLHLGVGEQLALLDNSGDEMLAEVAKSGRGGVEVRLLGRRVGKPEPTVRVILCQGLLKSARFEWILEKGTELGVSTFAPILCRRSMAGLEDAGPAKIQRWQRILQEAAEQCGRSRLPMLAPIRPLMHALNAIPAGALSLIPWEEEHTTSLREALTAFAEENVGAQFIAPAGAEPASGLTLAGAMNCAPTFSRFSPKDGEPAPLGTGQIQQPASPLTVALFIGPEGGLLAEEVKLAQQHGVQPVSLGPRILRAETAALAAVACVMYQLEQSSHLD